MFVQEKDTLAEGRAVFIGFKFIDEVTQGGTHRANHRIKLHAPFHLRPSGIGQRPAVIGHSGPHDTRSMRTAQLQVQTRSPNVSLQHALETTWWKRDTLSREHGASFTCPPETVRKHGATTLTRPCDTRTIHSIHRHGPELSAISLSLASSPFAIRYSLHEKKSKRTRRIHKMRPHDKDTA